MTEPTMTWKPHSGAQMEFLSRKEDFVLYRGGKGSGKSIALLIEALRQVDNKNYKALIIRRTYPQLQELIDRAHDIYAKLGAVWSGDLHRYTFPSGAFVNFGHCQSELDRERYQGHEYALICFDQLEQFLESQFNFICAQNRTKDSTIKCYVRATANPGGVGHFWIKRRFIDNREILKTYTDAYELPDGRTMTKTFCTIHATVYDNPTLLNANPGYLATLMSLPEVEKQAYLTGDWNAFASQCVFDTSGMRLQEGKVRDPKWRGYLKETAESFTVVEDTNGNLKIWDTPQDRHQYEIGVDVAEGDPNGDYTSVHVVDKQTWRVAAIWHGHRNPLTFAEILDSLGRYYNTAEISVEVPGPGLVTVQKLQELGYPSLYKYDDGKVGWRTDMSTRHHLISTLMDAIRGGHCEIQDRDTMDELYNFIRNEHTMKIEAREGTHDDRVMSLGIALQCIRVNPYYEPRKHKIGEFAHSSVAISEKSMAGRRKATGY